MKAKGQAGGKVVRLEAPLTKTIVEALSAGDRVLLSGTLYTARDAAHRRFMELLDAGSPLPFDPAGQIIYYVGPAPAPPGHVIGSAGPTTGSRMDRYAPRLLSLGIRAMIGKGARASEVVEALARYGAVYLAAVGGAAAYLASTVKEARVVAFEDLGTEAVRELVVEDFPAIVAIDCHGGDLFREGPERYRR